MNLVIDLQDFAVKTEYNKVKYIVNIFKANRRHDIVDWFWRSSKFKKLIASTELNTSASRKASGTNSFLQS